jgi:hypothetical protein
MYSFVHNVDAAERLHTANCHGLANFRFVPDFRRNIAMASVLLAAYTSNTYPTWKARLHEAGHYRPHRP